MMKRKIQKDTKKKMGTFQKLSAIFTRGLWSQVKAFKECIQTQSEAPYVIGRHIFRRRASFLENDRVQNLSWILRNQVALGTIRMAKMKLLDHVKWYSRIFGLILFVFLEKLASETNRFNRPAILRSSEKSKNLNKKICFWILNPGKFIKSAMADPASRKSATLNRLRSALRRKRESLADQFDFKIYVAVVFKDKVICIWLLVKWKWVSPITGSCLKVVISCSADLR